MKYCPHCGQILPFEIKPPVEENEPLTERLLQVLVFVAKGYTSAQIGKELGISRRTVEFHRKLLMERLRLRSTSALTTYAISKRLV